MFFVMHKFKLQNKFCPRKQINKKEKHTFVAAYNLFKNGVLFYSIVLKMVIVCFYKNEYLLLGYQSANSYNIVNIGISIRAPSIVFN